jgi:hypothetical protein
MSAAAAPTNTTLLYSHARALLAPLTNLTGIVTPVDANV